MTCLDENTVALYVDGRLAREEAQRAEIHLDTCAVCRELCAELARGATAPFSAEVFEPDAQFDRYQIMRRIGSGGMGEVYLARDTRLGRKVALKLIHPKKIGSTEAQRLFLEEARSTARFNHPNIVTLYDAGELNGCLFLALEYLEGESLRQRMKREHLGVLETVRIMRAIGEALREAHAAGVLHRDLKPGNVLIPKDGRVRIIDFGLAREALGADAVPMIAGTPLYMPPEAKRGERTGTGADMYAFGVMISELLKHEGGWPSALVALVDRCTASDPEKRPTASEACAALDALLSAKSKPSADASPYRGLAAFREEDADLFFGRDAELLALVELLRASGTVVIAGPSGAGKSSLVHAGLVPRLRESARWTVLSLRPGHDPVSALAQCLELDRAELAASPERAALAIAAIAAKTKSRVLLIVDQLEELFTIADSEDARRVVLRALKAAGDDVSSAGRVVVTVRDDFFTKLPELDARVFPVSSPDRAALLDALVRPLWSLGHRFEDERLEQEMIDAVQGSPIALPLLEFAAAMLWERRDREEGIIRRAAYEAMGGVAGALAQHADGVLRSLAITDIGVAMRMLLRLVGPENTRRVLRTEDLLDGLGEKAPFVLRRFIDARLIVVRRTLEDQVELELVHESLIRSWRTLARWIEQSRGDRPLLDQALEAASLWARRGRSKQETWSGAGLDEAERAIARAPSDQVPSMVREFLAASRKRARRRAFELRFLIALAVAAAMIFVVALYRQKEAAVSSAARALRESASAALLNGQHLEARAKLRSAMEVEDSVEARMLWWELERSPIVWKLGFDTVIRAFALSPDQKTIAVSTVDNVVRLADVETAALRTLGVYKEQVFALEFSPDGKKLATGTQGGRVGVWDLANDRYDEDVVHDGAVRDLAWDPTAADRFASTGEDGVVRIHRPGRSDILAKRSVRRIAFSPSGRLAGIDGRSLVLFEPEEVIDALDQLTALTFDGEERVIVGHGNGALGSIELASKRETKYPALHHAAIRRVALSGARVVSGSDDQTLRIGGALLDTGREPVISVAAFRDRLHVAAATYHSIALYAAATSTTAPASVGHAHPALSVCFTPDGKRLVSASTDRTLKIWDVASGRELATLEGHDGPVHEIAISPDGSLIASPSNDRTVRLWDLATATERARLLGHSGGAFAAAFSPDGARLASTGADRTVIIWDVARAKAIASFESVRQSGSIEYDASGNTIALGEDDGAVRLYDASTGALERSYALHRAESAFIAYSHDQQWIVSTGEDGMVKRVRLADGAIEDVAHTGGRAWAAAWDLSDHRIAIAASTGAWIKTLGTDQMIPLLGHRGEVNAIVLSPDGTKLATSGDDGTIRLWSSTDGHPLWGPVRPVPVAVPVPILQTGLEGLPSAPAQKISRSASGLLAIGFASGEIGLWNATTGTRLRLARLHGAITNLSFQGTTLKIESELGATDAWDLAILARDRCALLADLWKKVPVVWENGRAVTRAPPIAHACRPE